MAEFSITDSKGASQTINIAGNPSVQEINAAIANSLKSPMGASKPVGSQGDRPATSNELKGLENAVNRLGAGLKELQSKRSSGSGGNKETASLESAILKSFRQALKEDKPTGFEAEVMKKVAQLADEGMKKGSIMVHDATMVKYITDIIKDIRSIGKILEKGAGKSAFANKITHYNVVTEDAAEMTPKRRKRIKDLTGAEPPETTSPLGGTTPSSPLAAPGSNAGNPVMAGTAAVPPEKALKNSAALEAIFKRMAEDQGRSAGLLKMSSSSYGRMLENAKEKAGLDDKSAMAMATSLRYWANIERHEQVSIKQISGELDFWRKVAIEEGDVLKAREASHMAERKELELINKLIAVGYDMQIKQSNYVLENMKKHATTLQSITGGMMNLTIVPKIEGPNARMMKEGQQWLVDTSSMVYAASGATTDVTKETQTWQKSLYDVGNNIQDVYEKTGMLEVAWRKTIERGFKRGITEVSKLDKLMRTGASLGKTIGADAEQTAEHLADWSLKFGMSTSQTAVLAQNIRTVGMSTGVLGDNLLQAVRNAQMFAATMRDAGTFTEAAGKNLVSLSATAQRMGTDQSIQPLTRGMSSFSDFLRSSRGTQTLLSIAARHSGVASPGEAMSNEDDFKAMAGGFRTELNRLLSLAGVKSVKELEELTKRTDDKGINARNVRRQINEIAISYDTKGIGDFERIVQTFEKSSQTIDDQIKELTDTLNNNKTLTGDQRNDKIAELARLGQAKEQEGIAKSFQDLQSVINSMNLSKQGILTGKGETPQSARKTLESLINKLAKSDKEREDLNGQLEAAMSGDIVKFKDLASTLQKMQEGKGIKDSMTGMDNLTTAITESNKINLMIQEKTEAVQRELIKRSETAIGNLITEINGLNGALVTIIKFLEFAIGAKVIMSALGIGGEAAGIGGAAAGATGVIGSLKSILRVGAGIGIGFSIDQLFGDLIEETISAKTNMVALGTGARLGADAFAAFAIGGPAAAIGVVIIKLFESLKTAYDKTTAYNELIDDAINGARKAGMDRFAHASSIPELAKKSPAELDKEAEAIKKRLEGVKNTLADLDKAAKGGGYMKDEQDAQSALQAHQKEQQENLESQLKDIEIAKQMQAAKTAEDKAAAQEVANQQKFGSLGTYGEKALKAKTLQELQDAEKLQRKELLERFKAAKLEYGETIMDSGTNPLTGKGWEAIDPISLFSGRYKKAKDEVNKLGIEADKLNKSIDVREAELKSLETSAQSQFSTNATGGYSFFDTADEFAKGGRFGKLTDDQKNQIDTAKAAGSDLTSLLNRMSNDLLKEFASKNTSWSRGVELAEQQAALNKYYPDKKLQDDANKVIKTSSDNKPRSLYVYDTHSEPILTSILETLAEFAEKHDDNSSELIEGMDYIGELMDMAGSLGTIIAPVLESLGIPLSASGAGAGSTQEYMRKRVEREFANLAPSTDKASTALDEISNNTSKSLDYMQEQIRVLKDMLSAMTGRNGNSLPAGSTSSNIVPETPPNYFAWMIRPAGQPAYGSLDNTGRV